MEPANENFIIHSGAYTELGIIAGELIKTQNKSWPQAPSIVYTVNPAPVADNCITQNGLSSAVAASLDIPVLAGGSASPSSSSDAFAVISPNRAGIGPDLPLKNDPFVKQSERETNSDHNSRVEAFLPGGADLLRHWRHQVVRW